MKFLTNALVATVAFAAVACADNAADTASKDAAETTDRVAAYGSPSHKHHHDGYNSPSSYKNHDGYSRPSSSYKHDGYSRPSHKHHHGYNADGYKPPHQDYNSPSYNKDYKSPTYNQHDGYERPSYERPSYERPSYSSGYSRPQPKKYGGYERNNGYDGYASESYGSYGRKYHHRRHHHDTHKKLTIQQAQHYIRDWINDAEEDLNDWTEKRQAYYAFCENHQKHQEPVWKRVMPLAPHVSHCVDPTSKKSEN
jgi:hypothetical protein